MVADKSIWRRRENLSKLLTRGVHPPCRNALKVWMVMDICFHRHAHVMLLRCTVILVLENITGWLPLSSYSGDVFNFIFQWADTIDEQIPARVCVEKPLLVPVRLERGLFVRVEGRTHFWY
jgi:hypothetical protein